MHFFIMLFILVSHPVISQDVNVNLDTMNVEGDVNVQKKIEIDVEIIDSETGEDADFPKETQTTLPKYVPPKREEVKEPIVEEKKVVEKVVERKEGVLVPVIEEEFEPTPEVEKPPKETKAFDFIFDNSKKALIKTNARWRNIYISLGLMTFENESYQKTGSGGRTSRQWYAPVFKFEMDFSGENWGVSPNFLLSLSKSGSDGLLKKMYSGLGLNINYKLSPNFQIKMGSSVFAKIIRGKSTRQVELPDPQGTFFTNGNPRFSLMNTVDIGFHARFVNIGIEPKLIILSLFNSADRDYSYGVFFNYYFDLKKGTHHND